MSRHYNKRLFSYKYSQSKLKSIFDLAYRSKNIQIIIEASLLTNEVLLSTTAQHYLKKYICEQSKAKDIDVNPFSPKKWILKMEAILTARELKILDQQSSYNHIITLENKIHKILHSNKSMSPTLLNPGLLEGYIGITYQLFRGMYLNEQRSIFLL